MPVEPGEYIDDINWLDMRVGEVGTSFGRLSSVGFGNPGTIMLDFADWKSLVIHTDCPRDIKPIPLRSHVMVRCVRTEDGLHARAIWTIGGVPIPLVDGQEGAS